MTDNVDALIAGLDELAGSTGRIEGIRLSYPAGVELLRKSRDAIRTLAAERDALEMLNDDVRRNREQIKADKLVIYNNLMDAKAELSDVTQERDALQKEGSSRAEINQLSAKSPGLQYWESVSKALKAAVESL